VLSSLGVFRSLLWNAQAGLTDPCSHRLLDGRKPIPPEPATRAGVFESAPISRSRWSPVPVTLGLLWPGGVSPESINLERRFA
jgi:hypothetical protein